MGSWRISLVAAALALAFCFSTRLAYADGESVSGCSGCNGYGFSATITQVGTSSTYQVSYTITNSGGAASAPSNWSLTAFNNSGIVGSTSNLKVTGSGGGNYTSAYAVKDGKSNNGNSNCNSGISGAFCVEQTGKGQLPVLTRGQSLTFTFNVSCTNCSLMSSWDFLASGNPANNGHGNVYAISTWGRSTAMPEPSMVALYASTLAIGLVLAWRNRSSHRSSKG